MRKGEIIGLLPNIYLLDNRPRTRYEIVKVLKMDVGKQNYQKLDECADMGFLRQVNSNPARFTPDRKKIWEFWKKTPVGLKIIDMIADNWEIIGGK